MKINKLEKDLTKIKVLFLYTHDIIKIYGKVEKRFDKYQILANTITKL